WQINGQVVIGEEPEKLQAADISAGLLPTLGIKPQLGRNFTEDENVYGQNWGVVLISDRIWKRRYGGTPDVLGKTLRINGRVRTIVGVLPPKFYWPETSDFYIPSALSTDDTKDRADHVFNMVARLKPGVSQQQANAEIQSIYAQLRTEYPVALKNWSA